VSSPESLKAKDVVLGGAFFADGTPVEFPGRILELSGRLPEPPRQPDGGRWLKSPASSCARVDLGTAAD
jgi:hypothetical protein